jgi:hypothetical protein
MKYLIKLALPTTHIVLILRTIDKGHDDNTFWISQLDSYLRQITNYLAISLQTIEIQIYKGNITVYEGSPQTMCMPSQELSENDVYIRKMHSTYRLSELARKCKIMAMDIIAQVLSRLNVISDEINLKLNEIKII